MQMNSKLRVFLGTIAGLLVGIAGGYFLDQRMNLGGRAMESVSDDGEASDDEASDENKFDGTQRESALEKYTESLEMSFHVYIGHKGDLMVEYKLPASACWADLVLLGRDNDGASAVIVELKDWNTTCDRAGVREGLVRHADREQSHLSAGESIDGNVVLTTTSSAQNSNWQALFKNSAGHRAAHMTLGNRYNIVRACTHWQPAVTWIWRFR